MNLSGELRGIALSFTVALAIACNSSVAPALPRPPASSMQSRGEAGGLRVAAEPLVGLGRQEAVFGQSLREAGLMPILLLIENSTREPVRVKRREVALAFANGGVVGADNARDRVAAAFAGEGIEWDRAVGVQGGWGFGSMDLGLGYLFGEAIPQRSRSASRRGWELPEKLTLDPGKRIWAVVYFPTSAILAENGELQVPFSAPEPKSTLRTMVGLPVRELDRDPGP